MTDFHAYHNEEHILDILQGRISRLIEANGVFALEPARLVRARPVCRLPRSCASARKRPTRRVLAPTSAPASRRPSACSITAVFLAKRDADIYLALDLTIGGSTFDARPPPGGAAFNAAELVQSGGALAAKLSQKLDKHCPGWREDPKLVHAHELALIAADLDTANVAEPFARFAASAENLCLEREMLCRRDLDAGESAQPVLGFLTDGQDRFFFDLHRFNSDLGRQAFGPAKEDNASRLKSLSLGLRARIAMRGRPESGRQVLQAYGETVAGLI